jgi:hypothetical protein
MKRPFGGPRQVLSYLARYTHRVAISDHRLQEVTSRSVTFSYKDYRNGSATKSMTLKGEEFLRRFLLHVLPDGFMRIRNYGFRANGVRTEKLKLIRRRLVEDAAGESMVPGSDRQPSQEPPAAQDKAAGCCPACHKGTMQHLEELPAARPLAGGNEHRGPPEATP